MLRKVGLFLLAAAVFGCMASKTETAPPVKSDSKARQQQNADAAFAELEKDTVPGAEIELPGEKEKPAKIDDGRLLNKPEPEMQKPSMKIHADKQNSLKPDTKYPLKDGYPVWFYTPNMNGFIGAVGIAKPQPKGGYVMQKRTARALAQNDLARSVKVIVESELSLEKLSVDTQTLQYYRSKITSLSRHKAEETLSDFAVEDEWTDSRTGELYVWLVIRK